MRLAQDLQSILMGILSLIFELWLVGELRRGETKLLENIAC